MDEQVSLEVHMPLPSGNYLVIKVPSEYPQKDKDFVNELCEAAYTKMALSGERRKAQL